MGVVDRTFTFVLLAVDSLMDLLKTMSPAETEAEFRSLAPEAGGSIEWLAHFLSFLLSQLQTRRNFELVQSYLGLFLKVRIIVSCFVFAHS